MTTAMLEPPDGTGGRRDPAGLERAEAGDQRDLAGDQRDLAGDERDLAGDQRDAAGDRRDLAGDERDAAGDRRDLAGDERDEAADERDAAAEQRDRAAEQRDSSGRPAAVDAPPEEGAVLSPTERDRRSAAADRRLASRDRWAGASERTRSEADRSISAADRGAGGRERSASEIDRGRAAVDRGAGATDRTGAGQAEAVLRSAAGESERANRAKSDFLATMSHEIRTPLNGLLGMTALLLDTELEPVQREYAEMARSSGEALLSLISDLLDHAKIESGALELEEIDFDFRAVVEDVLQLAAASARHRDLDVEADVDPEVPALVRGDPGRLRQVLVNLTANAVKFTATGGVSVRVSLVAARADDVELRFEVEDTGVGLSAAERERLFRRFSQAEASTTRRFGGTGLGLAICKDLVVLLGGEIGVSSEPGAGSTFWFTLPFDRATGSSAAGASTAGVGEGLAHRGGLRLAEDTDWRARTRVLVAEDNVVNQLVAARTLENMGYRVDVVADGAEAVTAVTRGGYAAVLMDCQMPGMDGYEATAEIRRREVDGARTPIIAMTAAAGLDDEARCLEAGMDAYLSKPVRSAVLDQVLQRWIRDVAPVPEVPTASAAVLEAGTLKDLQALYEQDPEGVVGLVLLFLRETRAGLDTLLEHADRGETMAATAHHLQGSCATFAARRMAELCGRLEEAAGRDDPSLVEACLVQLDEEYARVASALHAVFPARSGPAETEPAQSMLTPMSTPDRPALRRPGHPTEGSARA